MIPEIASTKTTFRCNASDPTGIPACTFYPPGFAMSENCELPIETDIATVDALLKSGEEFLLLDVREPVEFAVARIEGSLLLPMSELAARISELDQYRDQLIVVHCHHGGRSLQVTYALRDRGFAKVQNMAGGIDAWSQQIDAAVARY